MRGVETLVGIGLAERDGPLGLVDDLPRAEGRVVLQPVDHGDEGVVDVPLQLGLVVEQVPERVGGIINKTGTILKRHVERNKN